MKGGGLWQEVQEVEEVGLVIRKDMQKLVEKVAGHAAEKAGAAANSDNPQ